MRIEILDEQGAVIDTAVGTPSWAASKYPEGTWRIAEQQDNPPINPVPQKVTRRQARQALLLAGLLDQVQTTIESIPDSTQRQLALIEWQDSLEFERSRPLLISLGESLGLDSQSLDQLFITANSL